MAPSNAEIIMKIKDDLLPSDIHNVNNRTREKDEPPRIVWKNAIFFFILHLMGLYGIFQIPNAHFLTLIWGLGSFAMNRIFWITVRTSRVWAHRSYQSKLPLRILLAIFDSIASQNDVIVFPCDHQAHHKFSETNADPHNAMDVMVKGAEVDLSDLRSGPVCRVQKKFYIPSVLLFGFVLPTVVPMYFWEESFVVSFFICAALRYCVTPYMQRLMKSAAHMWGNKPYDKFINPAENFVVAFGATGERYHNYRHVSPGDYSTSEHGWRVNFTAIYINCRSWLGHAYKYIKISHEAVFGRKRSTGNESEGFRMQFELSMVNQQ